MEDTFGSIMSCSCSRQVFDGKITTNKRAASKLLIQYCSEIIACLLTYRLCRYFSIPIDSCVPYAGLSFIVDSFIFFTCGVIFNDSYQRAIFDKCNMKI